MMLRPTPSAILLSAACAMAALAPAWAGETVLVPSKVIYPGETVSASFLQEVELAEGKVPPAHVVVAIEDLDGKVARRTLLPGRYVAATAIRDAWLVEKGAAVEMTFVAGALTIAAAAVTLESGAAGDMVKVRNIDTGKIVSGTVLADGTVRVGG
jgi:flagella basal body P-ring formation protein FlgA